jgi:hypothetical protein
MKDEIGCVKRFFKYVEEKYLLTEEPGFHFYFRSM